MKMLDVSDVKWVEDNLEDIKKSTHISLLF